LPDIWAWKSTASNRRTNVTYQSQAELENDGTFQQRNRASTMQQAETFKDDTRADIRAVADNIIRDEMGLWVVFVRLAAGGPGIADKVETPNGIDQALVTDADLLSLTQANWPTVAELYFAADGTPL
jgi:hypothetical protein